MSLDWTMDKSALDRKYADTVIFFNDERSVARDWTKTIVFETMVLDMGVLKTQDDVTEFKKRSDFWRTLNGEALLARDAIEAHIGLSTNVFPKKSWAQFVKKVIANWERDFARIDKRRNQRTLFGPGNLRVELDRDKVSPTDPGADTPAMV